eukprot:sb/3464382/
MKKKIFYQDETWANVFHQCQRGWGRTVIGKGGKEYIQGGMDIPTSEGSRIIISGVVGIDGFVKGTELVFEGVKVAADYHSEMNATKFEEYIEYQVLPNLPRGSVLVMDLASYHNRVEEYTRKPTMSWTKERIRHWLETQYAMDNGIDVLSDPVVFHSCMMGWRDKKTKKEELLTHVKPVAQQFCVDRILAEKGITVIRLPARHCEFNPIELAWAELKTTLAKGNVDRYNHGVDAWIKRVKEVMENMRENGKEVARKRYRHVQRVEQGFFTLDQLLRTEVAPVIIEASLDDDFGMVTDDDLNIVNDQHVQVQERQLGGPGVLKLQEEKEAEEKHVSPEFQASSPMSLGSPTSIDSPTRSAAVGNLPTSPHPFLNKMTLIVIGPRFTGMLGERILPGKSGCPVYRGQIAVNFLYRGNFILPVNRGSGKSGPGKSGSDCTIIRYYVSEPQGKVVLVQSDLYLTAPSGERVLSVK